MSHADSRATTFWRSWAPVWIAAFLAMLPLLAAYLIYIWRYEHYRYFPFAILLSGYLIWQRWDRQVLRPHGPLAWCGFGAALCLLLAGGLLYSPWIGAVAL